jgi:hypothetical protein
MSAFRIRSDRIVAKQELTKIGATSGGRDTGTAAKRSRASSSLDLFVNRLDGVKPEAVELALGDKVCVKHEAEWLF